MVRDSCIHLYATFEYLVNLFKKPLTKEFQYRKITKSMNIIRSKFSNMMNIGVPIVISTILLASVAGKLTTLDQFVRVLSKTFGTTYSWDRVLAVIIICFELSTAVTLLVPRWRQLGSSACAILLLSFLSFHALKWIDNISVPCLCFGALYKVQPLHAVLLSSAMLVGNEYIRQTSSGIPAKENS